LQNKYGKEKKRNHDVIFLIIKFSNGKLNVSFLLIFNWFSFDQIETESCYNAFISHIYNFLNIKNKKINIYSLMAKIWL